MNDNFTPHNGGPCPCHPKDIVYIKWRDEEYIKTPRAAENLTWEWGGGISDIDDIIAYKIVKTFFEVEQEKFEKTFPNLPHEKTNSGNYAAEKTQYVWEGWRARSDVS